MKTDVIVIYSDGSEMEEALVQAEIGRAHV